jgi:hypothetical protein
MLCVIPKDMILSYAADCWNGDGGCAFSDKRYGGRGDETEVKKVR